MNQVEKLVLGFLDVAAAQLADMGKVPTAEVLATACVDQTVIAIAKPDAQAELAVMILPTVKKWMHDKHKD